VKRGYKETEIGFIPDDWNAEKIGDHFNFKNGLNKAKSYFGYGLPIINYMDVFRHSGLYAKQILGKVDVNTAEQRAYSIRKGDVFFTRTSETPKEIGISTTLIEDVESGVFSGFVLRARPTDELFGNKFKKYCFSSSIVRKQIQSTSSYTTRALTNGKLLSNVRVPLPTDPIEQQAIAVALSDVDKLIEALEKIIGKKRAIKTATMQQLLTGKTRLPGFDVQWEDKHIGSFTSLKAGGTPSTQIKEYWSGDILWMSSGELHLKFVNDVQGRITKRGLVESAATLLPKDCVLIGLAGQGKTRGTVAINRVTLTTNQSVAAIYPSKCHSSEYLFYNLDSRYEELRELSSGDGGRGGLNLSILSKLKIKMPSLEEQKAIANTFMDIDRDLFAIETRLQTLKGIKKGMMQELLTGRTRLV